ncbi:hypothetical protein GF420_15605 [candidate division GN15 bacterium]|nr:hypothetical protein [candidate division GN15 bacterium]
MKALVTTFLLLLVAVGAQADDTLATPEEVGLAELTGYLGLRPQDISFRNDYTDPDSFRLAIVADLMQKPWGMIDYLDGLKNAHVPRQPEILAGILFSDLERLSFPARTRPYRADASEIQARYNLYFSDFNLNQTMTRAATYLDVIFPRSTEMMLARLSPEERAFLLREFKELVTSSVEEEFMSPQELDSLEKAEEAYVDRFVTFGTKIDPDPVVAAGVDCLRELLLEVKNLRSLLQSGEITAQEIMEGAAYLPEDADTESYLGRQAGWKVGGPGNDYYSGEYEFILDFGGDDIYDLSHGEGNRHGTIVIDLSGNDIYRAKTDFAVASGCLTTGILIDLEGNDRYDGKSFSLGSGYFGFGLLYDASGDDRYDSDTHSQGAGSFGLGLLIDEGGRDMYNAALYSQGFGFVQGIGIIYESSGADSYYAGGKYKDILRYEDHYLSLSQGFGYGLRPSMSGGVGAIIDLTGNDTYYADIFAQAASYWWSVGMIYDSTGNDNYQCFQYGQGAATHMTLGLLVDDFGNDVYFGKGLMQGCGHDYSAGILLDRHGNDTYTAYDLSQAAGSANGIGILIDNQGEDRYLIRKAGNSQGYGNPRRDFGSIGLFIDLGGVDQYQGNGRDNHFWRTDSRWGGGMDIELVPPEDTTGEGQ